MANVQPTLVMLDLDGTLIDSIGVFLSGLPAVTAQHGVPITPSDVFQDWGSGQLPVRGCILNGRSEDVVPLFKQRPDFGRVAGRGLTGGVRTDVDDRVGFRGQGLGEGVHGAGVTKNDLIGLIIRVNRV